MVWGWIAVVVIVIGLAVAMIWRIGASSQRPRKRPSTTLPDPDLSWESIRFISNGSQLSGWLLRKNDGMRDTLLPTIVIAHGWGSSRSRVLRYAKPLYEAGYAVFMYDARSHGDSEDIKAPSALMFRDDVLAAVEAVRTLDQVDPERIAVLGHSLGGFGAVLALAKGLRVRAIVTDSMPVRFETMMRAQLKQRGMPFFPLGYLIPEIWLLRARISRSEFRAANIPDILEQYAGQGRSDRTPVFLVHSNGDDFIPANDLRKLEKELPIGQVQTLFVDSVGHSTSQEDEAFWHHVLPFLNSHMNNK